MAEFAEQATQPQPEIPIPEAIFPEFGLPDEIRAVITREREQNHALRVGYSGSRADGTFKPNVSDTDLVVIYKKETLFDSLKGRVNGLEQETREGKTLLFGKNTGLPRLHILRYDESQLQKPKTPENGGILRKTKWLWQKGK